MKFKSSFMLVLAVLSFLMIFGCQKTRDDNAKIHNAIVAAHKQFMDTFSKSDDAGMAALYTENAQLLPTNSDFVTGNANVQALWKTVFDAGIKKAKLETVEVEGMGNTAYEVGKYTLFAGDDQVADSGKYVVIWKKANGQWKLHRDIWNTSMPAQ
ncbi:MAG: YybH family protein [bacterium]